MSSLPVENTSVVGETDATDMLLASDIGEQRRKRRNERDRKRSAARKEELNEMRKLVQEMEEKKNALVKKTSGTARVFSHIKDLALPSSPDSCSFISSVSTSTLTTASVREYVRLTAEAEAYRCQNAMMTKQLVERDLLYTILRTGLLEASQDKHSRVGSHFIPLSHEDGLTCMRKTLQYINNARLLYANDDSFQDRPTIFGWSQYCKRNGASINFAVRKSLPNVTPRELADTTWQFVTDSEVLNTLGPTQLKAYVTLVQKITDDLLVLDRRTEDGTHAGADGKMLILRTIYVAFRYEASDGNVTLALKTINLPLVKCLLREDETWCDIFYWMYYSSEDAGAQMTTAEFGGANTYASEEFAACWLEEALFLAIRWETLVFPPLLTNESADDA